MKHIIIDTYFCNGCGACVELCPETFRMDDISEKAALVELEPEITDAVLQAASYCPEKCIDIE